MFSNSVRSVIELQIGDEVRDLNITLDLMDRVRRIVNWEKLAGDMSKAEPELDLLAMAKFVYYNLKEAGFKPDPDQIYDEMMFSESNQESYIAIVGKLLLAYQPQGSKKKPVATAITKPKTSRSRKKA